MTIRQLKALLNKLPDDTEVIHLEKKTGIEAPFWALWLRVVNQDGKTVLMIPDKYPQSYGIDLEEYRGK